jgi:paraquat-inducible protein B
MTNEKPSGLPKAKIEKTRVSWLLWLVPAAAAALCGWFVLRDVILAGPEIVVYFQNVDGLQEGNSFVQYRGATVGEVQSLELTKDQKLVGVRTRLNASAAGLARQGAVFWIVRPELRFGSVRGLRTIVSGYYVTLLPGDGPPTNSFVGVEKQPLDQKGALEIFLVAPQLSSLQEGSPVFYRGMQVGEVLECRLGGDAREVMIKASIQEDYAPLVRINSKFWNAGGLNIHVGLFSGAKISAESPQTIVTGAIEFATPTLAEETATNGIVFALNDKPDDSWKKWAPIIQLRSLPPSVSQPPPPKTPSFFNLKSK